MPFEELELCLTTISQRAIDSLDIDPQGQKRQFTVLRSLLEHKA